MLPLYLLTRVLNFSNNSNRIAFDELRRALGISNKRLGDAKRTLDRAVEGLALFGYKYHHEVLDNGDVRFTDPGKREENIAAMREVDAEVYIEDDVELTEEDWECGRQLKAKYERECLARKIKKQLGVTDEDY